jgi:hypothetical protein
MIEFLQHAWPTLALLAGAAAIFLLLRNRATPIDALDEIVGNGQPVVVEVFSNT